MMIKIWFNIGKDMILIWSEQVWKHLGGLVVSEWINVKYIYKRIFIMIVILVLFTKD